jgi:hypothetical protein
MMELLYRLLMLLLMLLGVIPVSVSTKPDTQVGASAQEVEVTPVTGDDGQMDDNGSIIPNPLVIENVETIVMESYPYQVSITVTGYQPDGCSFPVVVEQGRDGSTVTVSIYRELDLRVMCPQVITPYVETIPLDGGFESGSYTIQVNDYTLTLEL